MLIDRNTYHTLLFGFPSVPPEAGAILGMKGAVVSECVFDSGCGAVQAAIYAPDTDRLNGILAEWASERIRFGGIVHSHPEGQDTLSSADKEYIRAIMEAMPASITELFFPLVLPGNQIISFAAKKQANRIELLPDSIVVL